MRGFLLSVLIVFPALTALGQVDTAWVRRYNGPGNGDDEAYAIAVDDSGNVYVTGQSHGSGTGNDYVTIKYYADGDTAWVRRYNGPGNGDDEAYAIAVDDSGNVYVTGDSYGSGTDYDYATIKYLPNGDTAWVRRYDGPVNHIECANAITVDDSGNAYVTGSSIGSGTGYDYATIKYLSNGDTAWVRRYNGLAGEANWADDMAIDVSGNIYVTGWIQPVGGGVTVKYYPNGDTAWVRRYDGMIEANDVAVDVSGNAYVAGSGVWHFTAYDYTTIKYYPNGDTAWIRTYIGSGTTNWANAIAVGDSGNVYVTGQSDGEEGPDYATIKYYPDGDTAWVRRFNGAGNSWDGAYAISVDAFGNVYVTGYSYGIVTDGDYATVKYYPNGDTAWVRRYNGPGNDWDFAYAIAVDGSSNVYVTGWSEGIGTNWDYATIKYIQTENYVQDETGNRDRPSEFTLSQNYPNPFNRTTKIEFTLAKPSFVNLDIYDILGRTVRTLASEHLSSGYKSVLWDGKNEQGQDVASGIYFFRVEAGEFADSKKMVILK